MKPYSDFDLRVKYPTELELVRKKRSLSWFSSNEEKERRTLESYVFSSKILWLNRYHLPPLGHL
jgi:hypothetical protein